MLSTIFPKAIAGQEKWMFLVFSIFSLACVFLGIATEFYYLFGLPFLIILVYVAIVDFQVLFFLLLAVLPFSIEIYLPGGLGIDLPAEPLMIFLTGVVFIYLMGTRNIPNINVFRHPITWLLGIHLFWIFISGLNAELPVIGLKVFAAKLWYIIPFFILPAISFKDDELYIKFFWIVLSILLISMTYVNIRHALPGLSFAGINASASPFFRNHVNYAAILVIFLPFIWAMYHRYKADNIKRIFLQIVLLVFLVSIYLTYTRAAQGSILIIIAAYFLIRYKIVKYVLIVAMILVVFVVQSVFTSNEYIYMAPDFEKTVSHEKFDNLIEATIKMEDISTMERFHRWVAGYHMVQEKPLIGFGPGNFYPTYQPFTVYSFETYVSDNPDRSGVHNYYLMTLVEQGFVGLLILLAFFFTILLKGEALYHKIIEPNRKRIVMASLMSIIVILSIMMVNDLLESLKIGSLFFLFSSFIVIEDLRQRKMLGHNNTEEVETTKL
jgi:O-antigen ligase